MHRIHQAAADRTRLSRLIGWEMVYRHHIAIEPIASEERDMIERHGCDA